MKSFSFIAKSLCVLCVLCGLAHALDRNAFTFTKYNLTATIDPDQQRLGVRGMITLRNDSSLPQKNLSLQISSSLSWKAIQFEGKTVEFLTHTYTSDIDHTGALSEAIVTLSREIQPKQTVELAIGYEGTIPLDTTRLTRIGIGTKTATRTDWDQISPSFTAVRGIGYVVWYPVATEAASLSDGNSVFQTIGDWNTRQANAQFILQMEVSSGDGSRPPDIIANGTECSEISEALGRAQKNSINCSFQHFSITSPAFVIAKYHIADNPAVSVHYLDNNDSAAEIEAQSFVKALPFVKGMFGAPHEKAEVLELPDPRDASYESGSMLLTPFAGMERALAESIAVHQLTHAAFYSPRPWIYEGLAHFAQAAYQEQENGRQSALDFLGQHLGAITNAEKASAEQHDPKATASEPLISTSIEEFYRSKAAYVWWMLRDMIGEAALKKTLATYHAEQDTDPAYLQKLIGLQTHRDLQWFFDDWVYHDRGLPDFRVASVYTSQLPSNGYLVTVTIENLGAAGAEVPVTLQIAGGSATQRLKVLGKSKNSIRFEVPSAPQQVTVNDGSVPESDMSNNTYVIAK
jgi:hypothetical protein